MQVGTGRSYEESHPWITFSYRLERDTLWCLLGEAASKCQHLAGTPLQPALASKLGGVYLIKGAVATTAIEGNTLTEAEVEELLETGRRLPPSQQYLQREVENVMEGLRRIDESSQTGKPLVITPLWIKEQNSGILNGLELEDHVVLGEYTKKRVVAGNYRGAPPEDIEYLVDQLCDWLNSLLRPLDEAGTSDEMRFFCSFLAATLGHLYIAWIHPFGDGNGRTARLLECAILAHSGVVPWVSSNRLSDHYNRTRSEYYRRLDRASKAGEVREFLTYSAQGYVDMLREQIGRVQAQQRQIAWINYVHEVMRATPDGPAQSRQRSLVLSMPHDRGVRRSEIRHLTPQLAELYAGKTDKTVSRDLNRLQTLGLIESQNDRWTAKIDLMDAFLPIGSKGVRR